MVSEALATGGIGGGAVGGGSTLEQWLPVQALRASLQMAIRSCDKGSQTNCQRARGTCFSCQDLQAGPDDERIPVADRRHRKTFRIRNAISFNVFPCGRRWTSSLRLFSAKDEERRLMLPTQGNSESRRRACSVSKMDSRVSRSRRFSRFWIGSNARGLIYSRRKVDLVDEVGLLLVLALEQLAWPFIGSSPSPLHQSIPLQV